jgi:TP901 family phage tail tape measure protein
MAVRSIGEVWIDVKPNMAGLSSNINRQMGGVADAIADPIADAMADGVQQGGEQASHAAASVGDAAGKSFGDKFKGGLNIASAAIVGAGAAGIAGLVAVGDTFDGVVDTIRAGTGATGDALDDLVESAKNVGKVTPASFDAIGPVVADLNTRLGLTGETLETVTSQVLEAGRVMGQELDVTTLSSAFSAFGIEGEAVEGAMDKIFVASQATGVGMNDLASIASKVAPSMKGLGYSFEETVGLVGTLEKAGIDATSVTGSMGKALVNLAKDGEKPQEAFRRTLGELEGFVKAGDELKANELAIKLFGTKGSTNFLNAIKSGKINMAELDKIAASSGDTILGVGEDTADFAETWQMFVNRMLVAVEPLASKVFGMVGEALDAVLPKIESMISWAEDNIETVKTWATVIGVLAAGILVLNGALTVYNVIVGIVGAATKVWAGIQWLLNTALLANPITWVVIAIVALIAILTALGVNWGDVFQGLMSGLAGFGSMLADWGKSIWQFFTDLFGGIANGWGIFTKAIGDFVKGTWDSFVSIGKGIANFFIGIVNGVIGAINACIDAINGLKITVPDWEINGHKVFGDMGGESFGPQIPRVPTIPALASGADVMGPTVALIGEQDPETVVNRGLMNRNLELQNERLEAVEKDGDITIIVNPSAGMDEKALAEAVVKRISWMRRR